jgi:hypothetical protein
MLLLWRGRRVRANQKNESRCTTELTIGHLHIRIGTANTTVRTRMQEMVPCRVAVSNNPNPLMPAFPKKQNACEQKLNCFHLVLFGTKWSAKPGRPKRHPI